MDHKTNGIGNTVRAFQRLRDHYAAKGVTLERCTVNIQGAGRIYYDLAFTDSPDGRSEGMQAAFQFANIMPERPGRCVIVSRSESVRLSLSVCAVSKAMGKALVVAGLANFC